MRRWSALLLPFPLIAAVALSASGSAAGLGPQAVPAQTQPARTPSSCTESTPSAAAAHPASTAPAASASATAAPAATPSASPSPTPSDTASSSTASSSTASSLPTKVLFPGMSGRQVLRLQKRLAALKYYPGATDGQFGSDTLEAVWAFQEVQGLTPSDEVNHAMLAALANPRSPAERRA